MHLSPSLCRRLAVLGTLHGVLLSPASALAPNAEGSPQLLDDICSLAAGRTSKCEVQLDVPAACVESDGSSSCPVVFFLHGAGGTNNGFAGNSGVHAEGLIGVYPEGENGWNTGPKNTNDCSWDEFDCATDPDEGAFIASIIAELRAQDAGGNVYVIGNSNGAALAHRLAVNAGEDLPIKGIVTKVTQLLASPERSGPGVLNYNNPGARQSATGEIGPRVSVLNVMGTADGLIPYEGGPSGVFSGETAFQLMPALESMEVWAAHAGCADPPAVSDVTTDTNAGGDGTGTFYKYGMYEPCEDGTIIEHYAINGAGHNAGNSQIEGDDIDYEVSFDFISRVEALDDGEDDEDDNGVDDWEDDEDDDGDDEECEDDPTWAGKFNAAHNCDYVSQNTAVRCSWVNSNDVSASDACPRTCGECDDTSSTTPSPTPADSDEECEDDPTWVGKYNPEHDCMFVGEDPTNRCVWENSDGIEANQACEESCDTCVM